MRGSTISTTVTHTVILDSAGYESPLTVTGTGMILPGRGGGDGVYAGAGVSGGRIANMGTIVGGASGRTGTAGGAGVHLLGACTVTNEGVIAGGAGRFRNNGYAAAGGGGIVLPGGGTLVNSGLVAGGAGGNSRSYGDQAGGNGVCLNGGRLANSGTIIGGAGGSNEHGYEGYGGGGGIGVLLGGSGVMTNGGTIAGGRGGTEYHVKGAGGGAGVVLAAAGRLTNSGCLEGGTGGDTSQGYAGSGGAGALLSDGGTLDNDGSIAGGQGGRGTNFVGGNGGTGAALEDGARMTNAGTISGGNGTYGGADGGEGGTGIDVRDHSIATNSGMVYGGRGGNSGVVGRDSGNGATVGPFGTLHNSGVVAGGSGNPNSIFSRGGAGISVYSGALVTNTGSVIGGASHALALHYATGAPGVYLYGGTLVNAGTIAGGASSGTGVESRAVVFGNALATLVLDPGAAFEGAVVADSSVDDTLVLAGTIAAAVENIGSEFLGFTTLRADAGSDWTVYGANTLGAGTQLTDMGMLSVAGTLTDAGHATIVAGGVVQCYDNGTLLIGGLTLRGGALSSFDGAVEVGAEADSIPGAIVVAPGARIDGYGTIYDGAIVDGGVVEAHNGTLTLQHSLSGTGTARIDPGATLVENDTLAVAHVVFAGAGATLAVATAIPTAAPFPLFAGFGADDVIDLRTLQATQESFTDGTLTLLDGAQVVDLLAFHGSYTAASFTLSSDDHGGTDIGFAAMRGYGDTVISAIQATTTGAVRLGCRDTAPSQDIAADFVHHAMW